MEAVEFETMTDGKTIHIPREYQKFVGSRASKKENVKVILMKEHVQSSSKKRKPGSAKGKFFMSDDFEQPLDEETAKLFYQ